MRRKVDSMDKFSIPVALICFKRIDTTMQILERIAAVQPKKLYILSDEGRNEEEKKIVSELRHQIENRVNWPCELIKNYAENNRGVFANIALGAKYVFERENCAIFLEDDNLPEVTFFQYCQEMLEKYQKDPKVLWICGTNYEAKTKFANEASYTFTRNLLPCGWASWSDKFLHNYDFELQGLDDPKVLKRAKATYRKKALYKQQMFNVKGERYRMDHNIRCLSWDSQMAFSIRASEMFGIVPCMNQIKNIGVDENSIHGGSDASFVMTQRFCGMDSHPLVFPLVHPEKVACDDAFELRLEKTILFPLSIRIKGIAVRTLKRILRIPLYEPIRSVIKKG